MKLAINSLMMEHLIMDFVKDFIIRIVISITNPFTSGLFVYAPLFVANLLVFDFSVLHYGYFFVAKPLFLVVILDTNLKH